MAQTRRPATCGRRGTEREPTTHNACIDSGESKRPGPGRVPALPGAPGESIHGIVCSRRIQRMSRSDVCGLAAVRPRAFIDDRRDGDKLRRSSSGAEPDSGRPRRGSGEVIWQGLPLTAEEFQPHGV